MGRVVVRALPVAALVLALAAPAAWAAPALPSVVGGGFAPARAHPWMASLRVDLSDIPGGYHRCGGTVVSPRKVVTAAHCFSPRGAPVRGVITGTALPDEWEDHPQAEGELVPVARITLHPAWRGWRSDGLPADLASGDLAVVTLRRDTPARALAVARPADAGLAQPGRSLVVSGWGGSHGFETFRDHEPASSLRRGTMQVWADAQCAGFLGADPARELCALGPNGLPRACYGDSGGPLQSFAARPPRLVGIVSRGRGCAADPRFPNVFVRASAYYAWLATQVPPAVRIDRVRCRARRCDVFLTLSGIADRVRRILVRARGRRAAARRVGGRASSRWRARIRRLPRGRSRIVAVPQGAGRRALAPPHRETVRIRR